MELSFRLAEDADLPRLAEINAQGFPGELERAMQGLPPFLRDHAILLAEAEGTIAALLYWTRTSPEEWYATQITVETPFRRKGIGEAVFREFLRRAADAGVRRILADARHDNQPSLQLLHKLGFYSIGTKKLDGGATLVLVRKDLSPA